MQSQRASGASVPQSLEASPATRPSPCIPEGTLTGADDCWALRCRSEARSLPRGLSVGVPYASGVHLPFFIHFAGSQKPQRKRAARAGFQAASAAAGSAQSPQLRTPSTWLRPRRPGSPRRCGSHAPLTGQSSQRMPPRERPGHRRGPGVPPATAPRVCPAGGRRGCCCWARVQANCWSWLLDCSAIPQAPGSLRPAFPLPLAGAPSGGERR